MILLAGCTDTINNVGVTIGKGMISLIFFALIPFISYNIGRQVNILIGFISFIVIEIFAVYGFSVVLEKDFISTAIAIWKIGTSWF